MGFLGFIGDIKNFIDDFTDDFGDDTRAEIQKLSSWERVHFSNQYTVYKDESGKKIDLNLVTIPSAEKNKSRGLKGFFKNRTSSKNKPAISVLIPKLRNEFGTEVKNYRSNLFKLRKIDRELRRDPVFDKINHLFCSRLKVLYNELLFCQFENLSDIDYFTQFNDKLSIVLKDLKTLNTQFSDYMYLLSRIKYEDNKQELAQIKICVEAMSDAVNQSKTDMIF